MRANFTSWTHCGAIKMYNVYNENDYKWIKELLLYPQTLEKHLDYLNDTSSVTVPDDPIENVIFQDRARKAIRKIAQNKGHILMVGKPGTGKSMLAGMFQHVLDKSLGDYIRPKKSIAAYPGKDNNHVRFAYADPEKLDSTIARVREQIEAAKNSVDEFSLSDQITPLQRVKTFLLWTAGLSLIAGIFFPQAFVLTGLTGIGAIFLFIQENNIKVQEKIQKHLSPCSGRIVSVKVKRRQNGNGQ